MSHRSRLGGALRPRRAALGLLLAGLWLGVSAAPALSHALLLQAVPQPGVVAPTTPGSVTLYFSEAPVAQASHITILGPDGKHLPTGPVVALGGVPRLSVRLLHKLVPAVYTVQWSALANDGHISDGSFAFGTPGARGAPPPGAYKLTGTAAGGRGGENAAIDGPLPVIGRWLGILAAATLLSGALLVASLRARGVPDGRELARRAAPFALLLLVIASVQGVYTAATAQDTTAFDFSVLTASATGKSALIRLLALAALGIVILLTSQVRPRRSAEPTPRGSAVGAGGWDPLRDALYGSAGLLALLSYGLSGHALSSPTAWTLLVIIVHVVTAGTWLGGVVALAGLSWRGGVRPLDGARAFAPIAGTALGLTMVTGVLVAIREVNGWYFLRWTGYGQVVIIKSATVALVAAAGATAFVRSRRGRDVSRVLVRAEAGGVVGVLALATVLAGLAQGRGQPLPAERGTLFAGPAFASALLPAGVAGVTLAPARAGVNTLAVTLPPAQPTPPAHISVLLQCGCSASQMFVNLHPGAGSQTWSASVRLPRVGVWSGTVRFDGGLAAVPVQLLVGVPQAPGSTPVQVLSVADLSGPDAPACRSHEIGLQMALARINASGGLDGGRKVAGLVLDSGGSAARARALTAAALARSHPIALAGVCGTGGEAAVEVASRAGVPSLVGDPAVGPTAGQNVFRLAADPYTQGLALGQLILQRVAKTTAPGVHTVRAVIASDLSGARLRAGLLAGIQGSGLRVDAVAPGALAAMPERRLGNFLSRTQSAAVVIDEPGAGGADARAIAAVGRRQGAQLQPAPVLASERVLNENWILSAGTLGRIGALQGVSDVSPSTADGTLYQRAVQLLYRGEIASVDGLRGYVTGLALIDAVRRGIGASQIDAALRRPDVFTSALLAPWNAASPGVGSPAVVALQPQFLSTTLVPAQLGGESQDTTYFPSGSWTVTSPTPFGEKIGTTPPSLAP